MCFPIFVHLGTVPYREYCSTINLAIIGLFCCKYSVCNRHQLLPTLWPSFSKPPLSQTSLTVMILFWWFSFCPWNWRFILLLPKLIHAHPVISIKQFFLWLISILYSHQDSKLQYFSSCLYILILATIFLMTDYFVYHPSRWHYSVKEIFLHYTYPLYNPLYFLTNQHACLKWSKHMAAAKRRFDHQHYKVVMATVLQCNCQSIQWLLFLIFNIVQNLYIV